MKIAESSIQFVTQHTSIEKYQKQESLTVWGPGEERETREESGVPGKAIDVDKELSLFTESATKVELSKQAKHAGRVREVEEVPSRQNEIMMDLNIRILKAMIERLTGKRIDLGPVPSANESSAEVQSTGTAEAEPPPPPAEESPQGGLIYDYHESYYESESTSFSSNGTIVTEDGQEIDFSVTLSMSREFYTEQSLHVRAGDAVKDPLVINFSGKAAELTQDTFAFDIDNDGTQNQISFLQPGSGFLALDKNGDNVINNGSELFGPESGNGFQDLAAYDSDNNNWIDENDAIFHKLRIWTKDAEGNDVLFGLGEKGIGAIYLDSAQTLFSLKDRENTLQGQVQSTSIFLGENGGVGTVQQIDLVT